jgi:hypothetical protein
VCGLTYYKFLKKIVFSMEKKEQFNFNFFFWKKFNGWSASERRFLLKSLKILKVAKLVATDGGSVCTHGLNKR